ncbi:phosphatase PAP2 family protein [Micromonospora sp. NPDC003197]
MTRLARIVTEVTAPAVLVTVLFVAVGWHSTRDRLVGLGWGLLAAIFASVIPFAFIVGGVRRGRLTDHHVGERRQRRTPLLIGLVSVAVGLVLMVALDAPRPVLALVVAGAIGLVVGVGVGHRWKLSIHTAVAAAAAVIVVLVFGPAMFVTWPVLGLVGWSRIHLGAHTIAQVVAGGVVGGLVAGAVFVAALR